jgi:sporulation protein YlmC with PRC-barrel domain
MPQVCFIVRPAQSFGITSPNTQRLQPKHGPEAKAQMTPRLKLLGFVSKIARCRPLQFLVQRRANAAGNISLGSVDHTKTLPLRANSQHCRLVPGQKSTMFEGFPKRDVLNRSSSAYSQKTGSSHAGVGLRRVGEHCQARRVLKGPITRMIFMKYAYALTVVAALTVPALAAETMSSLPPDSSTITNYYKQDVYDKGQNTVGKIDDVLIDKSGKITALIVGVGGFLGIGEKDVALPFSAVKSEQKNNKWYLTVDETKDSLKSAAGYKYDSSTTTWSKESK